MHVCKPCHYILAEAVEFFQTAFHFHVIHLLVVWAPSQDVDGHIDSHSHHYHHRCFPRFGELAKILPDASVQTMPLCFGWGCRTFQTVSHVHVIYIWGVWASSQVVDGHMASQSHRYHHRHFPRFVRVDWNQALCKCANHATMLWLKL
jgi:hypothetical protein